MLLAKVVLDDGSLNQNRMPPNLPTPGGQVGRLAHKHNDMLECRAGFITRIHKYSWDKDDAVRSAILQYLTLWLKYSNLVSEQGA